jgi:hypothetical protein
MVALKKINTADARSSCSKRNGLLEQLMICIVMIIAEQTLLKVSGSTNFILQIIFCNE